MAETTREILFECRQVGNVLRVAAVDAATGTEAVFQAPLNAGKADLRRMAVRKLDYVMRKQGKG
ncbi:MAG TPA: hypothetical protein VMV79_03820 [Alphaproteobacteria bacterium]|nr:hypothetical protein [Alphaproteobacteria bacterium]